MDPPWRQWILLLSVVDAAIFEKLFHPPTFDGMNETLHVLLGELTGWYFEMVRALPRLALALLFLHRGGLLPS